MRVHLWLSLLPAVVIAAAPGMLCKFSPFFNSKRNREVHSYFLFCLTEKQTIKIPMHIVKVKLKRK